jgi:hypothetical protein
MHGEYNMKYVAYVLLVLKNFHPFLYFDYLLRPPTNKQWLVYK